MQLLMSFLETPDEGAPLWAALDEQQRDEVVTTLARLIAKVAAPHDEAREHDVEEVHDD